MLTLDNNCIVIFGASGDLTQRMLIPALFKLYTLQKLSSSFAIIGVSRSPYDDQSFRDKLIENLALDDNVDQSSLDKFCEHIFYQAMDPEKIDQYTSLKQRIHCIEMKLKIQSNTLFYLATPPSLYSVIPKNLAAHSMNVEDDGWKRLVIEKTFWL